MRLSLKNFMSNERAEIDVTVDEVPHGDMHLPKGRSVGVYGDIGMDRIGLFSVGTNLFIYLNGRATAYGRTAVSVSLSRSPDMHELLLRIGEETHLIIYARPRSPMSTQFYAEDEEDVDFGLWLCNVLGSSARRRIVADRWEKGI